MSRLGPPLLHGGERRVWLLYARAPPGPPPRRWRGLVGYGRLDVAARVLLAALYPGGRLLGDSALLVFLDRSGGGEEGSVVGLHAGCLPGEMLYEREAAALLLDALRGRGGCPVAEGLSLRGLLLSAGRAGFRRLLLSEDGGPLGPGLLDGRLLLLLGGAVDPPAEAGPVDARVRVGCRSYLASSVAAYINAVLLLEGSGGGR